MSDVTAGQSANPGSNGRATPPELSPPRRGRPPGSTNRPKEVESISVEALTNAWHGLWLLSKIATWFVAGRQTAPIARWASATYELEDLPDDEARADAKNLVPIFRDWPVLARVLTWIGAPVLLARRVQAHLRKEPFARPAVKPVVAPAPAMPPSADDYAPEPGVG